MFYIAFSGLRGHAQPTITHRKPDKIIKPCFFSVRISLLLSLTRCLFSEHKKSIIYIFCRNKSIVKITKNIEKKIKK